MKNLIIALSLLAITTTAYAACSTNQFWINGKLTICQTCCTGNNCQTICF